MHIRKLPSRELIIPDVNFDKFSELYLQLIQNTDAVADIRSPIVFKVRPEPPPDLPPIQEHISIRQTVPRSAIVINTPRRSPSPPPVRNKLYNDTLYDDARYRSSKRNFEARKQGTLTLSVRPLSNRRRIPTLRELEKQDAKYDYNDEKRELMFKLELLQKQYPTKTIPSFSLRSDYHTMKKTYDIIIKQLQVDSSVESYKNYLVGGFMICEMTLGRIGFDMDGFTQQQLLSMSSYEKLLIELGEKSYAPMGMDQWPVEARLALTIFFNAVLFVVAKLILKKTKINILKLINEVSFTKTAPAPGHSDSPISFATKIVGSAGPRSKMKGPKDEGFEST